MPKIRVKGQTVQTGERPQTNGLTHTHTDATKRIIAPATQSIMTWYNPGVELIWYQWHQYLWLSHMPTYLCCAWQSADVSLEIAGFLSGLGFDTSVAIRSKPLRLFDQVNNVIRLQVMTLFFACDTLWVGCGHWWNRIINQSLFQNE